jgi:hypothetical protein
MGLQSRLVSPGCATGTEGRYEPGLKPGFPLVLLQSDLVETMEHIYSASTDAAAGDPFDEATAVLHAANKRIVECGSIYPSRVNCNFHYVPVIVLHKLLYGYSFLRFSLVGGLICCSFPHLFF